MIIKSISIIVGLPTIKRNLGTGIWSVFQSIKRQKQDINSMCILQSPRLKNTNVKQIKKLKTFFWA